MTCPSEEDPLLDGVQDLDHVLEELVEDGFLTVVSTDQGRWFRLTDRGRRMIKRLEGDGG